MLEFYEQSKFVCMIKEEVEVVRETRKELNVLSKIKLRKYSDPDSRRQRAYTFTNSNKQNY